MVDQSAGSSPAISNPSSARHPNNLPAALTPIIGREREVLAVRELLQKPEVRLVTLTGPGGIGKTRLSLQIASDLVGDFAGGVFFVALAPINFEDGIFLIGPGVFDDPDLVVSTVAQVLGVREAGGRPIDEILEEYLQDREMLLVLDNFERVVLGSSPVASLLAVAPRLKVLVTSRSVLHLHGENVFPVPPLALPFMAELPPPEMLAQYAAVQLFIERARAVNPDFTVTADNAPAIAEVCFHLDGLPLAIELAAARADLLPPHAILAQLLKAVGQSFLRLLTGGAHGVSVRQQTLRAAIAWSSDMLHAEEQKLFRRLAVFSGGCTEEAAAAVSNAVGDLRVSFAAGLQALVENRLLQRVDRNGQSRLCMLESIRGYGLKSLAASQEMEEAQRCHAEYFLSLAQQTESELNAPGMDAARNRWLDRVLEVEQDNLRAAFNWFLEHAPESALRLVMTWWHVAGGNLWTERREALDRSLEKAVGAPPALRATALRYAGELAYRQADYAQSRAQMEASLELSRQSGDRRGIAAALTTLSLVALEQNDDAMARASSEQSLAISREMGDQNGIAWALQNLGHIAKRAGDDEAARSLYAQSLEVFRDIASPIGIAWSLQNLGGVASNLGEYDHARSLLEESLAAFGETGARSDSGRAWTLALLGEVATRQGDPVAARAFLEESLTIARQLKDNTNVSYALWALGNLARGQGHIAEAQALYRESLARVRESGNAARLHQSLAAFGHLALAAGKPERATRIFGATEALGETTSAIMSQTRRADFDQSVTAARAALGTQEFSAAWQAGQAMSLEQVISYVLDQE